MHMTCRPPGGCGYEFCWICLADWKQHKECNRFAQEDEKATENRADLARYIHYRQRFGEHERAQEFANDTQRDAIAKSAKALHDGQSIAIKDLEFLSNAVNEIVACRRFLKWTYAYAYLNTEAMEAAKQTLFEFHQGQLECTLERLSDVTENTAWHVIAAEGAVSNQSFPHLRAKVVSIMDVVKASFATLSHEIANDDIAFG